MIFFCICLVLLVSCTTETVMVDEEEIAQEVSVEVLPENEEVNSDETLTEVGETEIENEVDSPVLEKETTLEAEEAIKHGIVDHCKVPVLEINVDVEIDLV